MRKFINIIEAALSGNLPEPTVLQVGYRLYHGTPNVEWNPEVDHISGSAFFGSYATARSYGEEGRVHEYEVVNPIKLVDFGDLVELVPHVDYMEDDYAIIEECREFGYDGWITNDEIMVLDTSNVKLVEADYSESIDFSIYPKTRKIKAGTIFHVEEEFLGDGLVRLSKSTSGKKVAPTRDIVAVSDTNEFSDHLEELGYDTPESFYNAYLSRADVLLLGEYDIIVKDYSVFQSEATSLKYVENQTPKACLAAVKKDPTELQYVHDQTFEVCMAAIKKSLSALQYVREQTPELCMAAVLYDPRSLIFVRDQTREICMAAVTKNGYALTAIKDATPEMVVAAITQEPAVVNVMPDRYKTPEAKAAFDAAIAKRK